jgi:DNA end-binding protein Ku
MARPSWEGHLRLSLVTCPVELYAATTKSRDISFHMIHKKTHNRIKMVPHDPELGEVKRSDLTRGFEFAKNKYILVSNDDIASVRIPSNKTIDIERFVDLDSIDRIYWDTPYFLVPQGETGIDAFVIIRKAMEESKKVALARVVMHTRERIVALEPRGKGILLTTLHSADEVRDETDYFDKIESGRADKKMLEIAEKIIDQQAADFDPTEFTDRYEEALRDLIEEKKKGHEPVHAEEPDKADNVIDLMDALKKSLKGNGRTAKAAPAARHEPKKRTGGRRRKA